MELKRITLPPITAPGDVTTFYSFESGTARSVALSNTAVLLAGRHNATLPVLMIDWDTESPGLHHHFGRHEPHLGLLEYFQACADHLTLLGRPAAAAEDTTLARQVLEAVDWELYVERVDESRPLYLMRAGLFDDTYGERADRMDWDGLFAACPALFRCFGEHLARRFRHVLVDARSGRSAAVSICTTLLPQKLVTLFTPNQRSLDGLAGVVTRAIDYRCSHEEEQRPLLVYPMPSAIDSADCERRVQWRRGDPQRGLPGYQPVLEKLLRQCYSLSQLSLDSYFDEVQLQQTNAMSGGEHLPAVAARDADRFSLTRTFEALLEWLADGRFPWQSLAEVRLSAAIAGARGVAGDSLGGAVSLQLARDLNQLGELYREQRRPAQALACFEESLELRRRVLGDEHRDTRISRANLAALLRDSGRLPDASFLHEVLYEDCHRLLGADHPDTLAARSALAATLSTLGEFERALSLHEQVIEACERLFGPTCAMTLDSLAGQAQTYTRRGEFSRARMVYERVLEGRERLLGSEHADTLRCAHQLATLLCELGDLNHARNLQEGVVAARDRQLGNDHPLTLEARELLAEILAGQSDIDGVRRVLEALAAGRERSLGAEHPDTLSIQLKLASMLSDQGELDAARRLQQQLVSLHERVHGADDLNTLNSKRALATTLSRQGHSLDARRLEDSVLQGSARLINKRGMASGPHDSHAGVRGLRAAILDRRDSVAQADDMAHAETLGHKLAQLQQLIDNRSEREARELADALRKSVLRPDAANPLRLRGVAMIKQVYLRDNDKDALLSFAQDEVSSLQEALLEAAAGRAVSVQ